MELAEGMTEIFKNLDCAHLFKLLNLITATRMPMRMMGAHLPGDFEGKSPFMSWCGLIQ